MTAPVQNFLFRRSTRLLPGAILLFATIARAGLIYPEISPTNTWWPGGIIPYEFDTNYVISPEQKAVFLDGIREWEMAANIRFVPRTAETNFLLLRYQFSSGVDTFTLNPPILTVDNLQRFQLCHEMGHALGLDHEHVRPDRDSYITVLFTNMDPAVTNLYLIASNGQMHGTYDFESVMHYGRGLFSTNGLDTLVPNPPYFDKYYHRIGSLALSVGDRAASAYLYGAPTNHLTNIVTNTRDGGFGSLRAAIYFANDNPGTTITFNIPTNDPGYSNGFWTIKTTGELPPLTADGTVIDGGTQPGYTDRPVVILDGSPQLVADAFLSSGLHVYAANCSIKKIGFNHFSDSGLELRTISATNNRVLGCSFGIDSTGAAPAPNAFMAVHVSSGARNNFIGGTNIGDRNFISGSGQYGVFLSDSNTAGNVILGNYVGLGIAGTNAVPNTLGGVIVWSGAGGNTIGGTTPGARNVISGNDTGVYLVQNTSNNIVQGNYIGTDPTGSFAIGNNLGGVFVVSGAHDNLISGNLISGNTNNGVVIADPGTDNNVIEGNFIGTDAAGALAVPNGNGIGVFAGAQNTVIGGTNAASRNIVSGNRYTGIVVTDTNTAGTRIVGNYIGLNPSGTGSISNSGAGILILNGAFGTTIGGMSAGAGNAISGNAANGIGIFGMGTTNNVILGNFIGTTADGTNALGNHSDNVSLADGASFNVVGGHVPSARNVIAAATFSGIFIAGSGTTENIVQGNFIGTDTTGTKPLGNGGEGIGIFGGAQNNLIGGSTPVAGNVIGANTYRGIFIADAGTTGNWIQGNNIGIGADNSTPLPNGFEGVAIGGGATSNVIGLTMGGSGVGNRIAFNTFAGVYVGFFDETNSVGNTIRGNMVYSNDFIGIELAGGIENFGVTENDSGDADAGPNRLQNFPAITNAFAAGGTTTIAGRLDSTANRSFLIDVYRNVNADASGYGEGEIYVGAANLTTDAGGSGNFTLSTSGDFAGQFFTATATDTTTGDTSEFSLAVLATNAPAPPQFAGQVSFTSTGLTLNVNLNIGTSYRIQATTNLAMNPIPWIDLTNFLATNSPFQFTDQSATNFPTRFYRAVSP